MDDEQIRGAAIEFAKRNKMRIAQELIDPATYPSTEHPISVFMAGSPGAGKTEFSKNLISILEEEGNRKVIRIDPDDVRSYMPGYTGSNSNLFHGAVSLIVEKMHDLALHQRQNFVFDGTFSKYQKAAGNIDRSLSKERPVFIFYIYQRPELAWRFTEAREAAEGRNIPKLAFIEQFLGARETIDRVSAEFQDRVGIFIIQKDFERNRVEAIVKMLSNSKVDDYIAERYSED